MRTAFADILTQLFNVLFTALLVMWALKLVASGMEYEPIALGYKETLFGLVALGLGLDYIRSSR